MYSKHDSIDPKKIYTSESILIKQETKDEVNKSESFKNSKSLRIKNEA